MTALLDVPQIRERVSPISVAEYHQLGEFNENARRTELIRGIILEKMSKSPLHYSMIERLRAVLAAQIRTGWLLRQEGPLTLTDSEPEPDLAIVLGKTGDFDTAHPTTAELVVEIAVSSLELDRAKSEVYAQAGVKEYWIVRPQQKDIEVYRQSGPGGYAEKCVAVTPDTLESAAVPGVRVDLSTLFI